MAVCLGCGCNRAQREMNGGVMGVDATRTCIDVVPCPTDIESMSTEANIRRRDFMRALRRSVIEGYGARCNCCGESRYEFLTLDHVDGRGAQDRRENGSNARDVQSIYRRVFRAGFPPGYQVLCYNCNCAKHIYKECPHRRESAA